MSLSSLSPSELDEHGGTISRSDPPVRTAVSKRFRSEPIWSPWTRIELGPTPGADGPLLFAGNSNIRDRKRRSSPTSLRRYWPSALGTFRWSFFPADQSFSGPLAVFDRDDRDSAWQRSWVEIRHSSTVFLLRRTLEKCTVRFLVKRNSLMAHTFEQRKNISEQLVPAFLHRQREEPPNLSWCFLRREARGNPPSFPRPADGGREFSFIAATFFSELINFPRRRRGIVR